MGDVMEGPDRYVRRFRPINDTCEAAQIASSIADDMPNRLSIAAISGWLLACGFDDFKVVRDHGELGLDLWASLPDQIERASPGDWVVFWRGDWVVVPDDHFRKTFTEVA